MHETLPQLHPQPTLILTGAYGSGKTECALELAHRLTARGPVTLVDLDFVTPYFRAQDCLPALTAAGIRVIAPEPRVAQIDAPALPAEVRPALVHPEGHTIVDLGGDPIGAVVLGQFAPAIPAADLWAVVNFARPTTPDPEQAAALLLETAAATRLPLTGLISNTHLGPFTTPEDLRAGLAQAHRLGDRLGVPVVLLGVPAGCAVPDVALPTLTITPRLRRPWDAV